MFDLNRDTWFSLRRNFPSGLLLDRDIEQMIGFGSDRVEHSHNKRKNKN